MQRAAVSAASRQRVVLAALRGKRGHAASASQSYDAVIVGAGVMGASIAFEMSKAGWKTLNVEQGPLLGQPSSTAMSCGVIRTMYSHIDSVKLAYEGSNLWENWAQHVGGHDEDGPAVFTRSPAVLPCVEASKTYIERGLKCHDELGIPYEFIDNQTLQERFPYLDVRAFGPPGPVDSDSFGTVTGELNGALTVPGSTGYVSDTVLATQNLMKAAQASGATFAFNSPVTAVLKSQGRASGIQLADGTSVSAGVVINAAGPWSGELNKLAFAGDAPADDSKVRTQPMRVEVAYPPAPPGLDVATNGCVITDFDTGVYMRPATGGRICIGSIEPPCDSQHHLGSMAEFEDYLSDPVERQTYRFALRVPTLPIPNSPSGVSHCYDKSDDFTPIYDKTALPGFYTAIGTSGNQFKNCGVVGQLMTSLVEACENGHAHDSDPLQFRLPLTQNLLNLGTFSRLRSNNATSNSVLG